HDRPCGGSCGPLRDARRRGRGSVVQATGNDTLRAASVTCCPRCSRRLGRLLGRRALAILAHVGGQRGGQDAREGAHALPSASMTSPSGSAGERDPTTTRTTPLCGSI